MLPARSIQEISPDLENEHAWTASIGFQRQLGARTSVAVDANINRGIKHGFLDMNAPVPIPKDVLNAALAANPNATFARWRRPIRRGRIVPGPNSFRHMDLLTNEGRSWYQGVRISVMHRTTPLSLTASYTRSKAEDRLNHWFSPENSRDPESDRGPTGADTPHNLVTSITWNIPGSGPVLSGWRLSTVSHTRAARPIRSVMPATRWATARVLGAACNSRGCQPSTPGGRNTARGMFINYADLTTGETVPVGTTTSRCAPTCSTCSTTRTCSPAGTSTWSATRGSGSTRAGRRCFPAGSSSSRRRIGSDASLRLGRLRLTGRHVVSVSRVGRLEGACEQMTRMLPRRACAALSARDHVARRGKASPVRVRVQTELGDIVVEVDQANAPVTSANFLQYVDAGHYDGGIWHRTVKMDNQPESPVKIEVIQAGVNPETAKEGFPADRARAHQPDRDSCTRTA